MNFTSRLLCGIAVSTVLLSPVVAGEGKVLSAINTLSYTYVEVIQDDKTLWLAADVIKLEPGDQIRFNEGIMMTNFHSSDLERTFTAVTFVEQVKVLAKK